MLVSFEYFGLIQSFEFVSFYFINSFDLLRRQSFLFLGRETIRDDLIGCSLAHL